MFFTSISQMMTESVDLTLVIRKANGQLTVSTLPKANGLKDEAANHIIPLTLTGTPEEMDAEFLQHIMQPIRKATGLISNLMEFEKQADKAAANSKAAKDAKAKETKEEKEKREKYEKHMKKAEEFITAKNHKDAITALQQARMYATADKQKEVDEKIAAQKKAMNQGSLFEMMEETPAPAPQVAQPQNVAPQPQMQQQMPYGYGAAPMPGYMQPQMPYGQPMPGYGMPPVQNVNVQPASFQPFTGAQSTVGHENIDLIMDVPLEVTVELGRTTKSIKEILEFAPGTIVELNKIAGEPIDVLVNRKYVAKGEVVVIEESFGIKITEIIK